VEENEEEEEEDWKKWQLMLTAADVEILTSNWRF